MFRASSQTLFPEVCVRGAAAAPRPERDTDGNRISGETPGRKDRQHTSQQD